MINLAHLLDTISFVDRKDPLVIPGNATVYMIGATIIPKKTLVKIPYKDLIYKNES